MSAFLYRGGTGRRFTKRNDSRELPEHWSDVNHGYLPVDTPQPAAYLSQLHNMSFDMPDWN